MLLVGKILLGAAGSVVALGALISSEGFVNVRVQEKKPAGMHLHIFAPVLPLNVALHLVPRHDLKNAAEQVRSWLQVIDTAVEELRKSDGIDLVEVNSPGQHVKAAISGGSMIVDVTDEEYQVHVSLPLSEIDRAAHEIANLP